MSVISTTPHSPLGSPPPPNPTWDLTVQVLIKHIEEFEHDKILLSGITPALSATLIKSRKLPPPFLVKSQGKEDLMGVQCQLLGEAGTPLEGGRWELEVFFPIEFPWKPPTYHLITPHFHSDIPLPELERNRNRVHLLFAEDLHQRLLAAKELLTPPPQSPSASFTLAPPPLNHLAQPTMIVTFQHIDQSQHKIACSLQDSVSALKLRYQSHTQWHFTSESLMCKGKELSNASIKELEETDIVFLVRQLYHGPCGPFLVNEGACDRCRRTSNFFSFDICHVHGASRWLQGVEEMRDWLHQPVQNMRKEMMIQASTKQHEMKWNPWIAVWQRDKVRNLHAAVLLAEGKMGKYEKEMKRFTATYAMINRPEPTAPPPAVVVVSSVPPPPPPPLSQIPLVEEHDGMHT